LVKAGEQTFAFPLKLVKKALEISGAEMEKAKLENLLEIDGAKYSISSLNNILNLPPGKINSEHAQVLLVETSEQSVALIVDEIIKTEEIVIKPLGAPLKTKTEFLGASILGDGRVVPVLDLMR